MTTALKNVLEPVVIILIFAVGVVVNRRRPFSSLWSYLSASDAETPLLHANTNHPARHAIPIPDNTCFRQRHTSRLLALFPFTIEIFYWLLTYWPYQLLRAASAVFINADPQRKAATIILAQAHASEIMAIESRLGVAIELQFQRFVLRCHPMLMGFLKQLYLAHIAIGIAFLAYGFTYFPRRRFTAVRRTIALDNLLAFPILSFWRCAPPRLMPRTVGFVDVIHAGSETSAWANNRFQLTLAAMPSLHFGTSVLLATSIVLYGRHQWLRILAPLYPMLMGLSVVATANHWVLDCVVGVCVVAAGSYFNRVLLGMRPVEEWIFWLCQTERPQYREDGKGWSV
ncbi:Integral membrane protein [Mycena indigotica]|uniref:Integral membrane protein n=1 Tax=Mycena indigotica TaxID=2126181 RepID=A0A8H6SGZ8_9AGAR|nr:Integral membrane protein [Mycena indigotica]KAF7299435.1 Integral membrane protein [Mycena indigotica]